MTQHKTPGPAVLGGTLLPWLSCHGNVRLAVERILGATVRRAQLQPAAMPTASARTGSAVVMPTHDVDEAVRLVDPVVMTANRSAATISRT